jgi:hypothetical protein
MRENEVSEKMQLRLQGRVGGYGLLGLTPDVPWGLRSLAVPILKKFLRLLTPLGSLCCPGSQPVLGYRPSPRVRVKRLRDI